jgi:hypothetical protein
MGVEARGWELSGEEEEGGGFLGLYPEWKSRLILSTNRDISMFLWVRV